MKVRRHTSRVEDYEVLHAGEEVYDVATGDIFIADGLAAVEDLDAVDIVTPAEITALRLLSVGYADATDDDPAVVRPTGFGTILWKVNNTIPTNAVAGDILADISDDTVIIHTP